MKDTTLVRKRFLSLQQTLFDKDFHFLGAYSCIQMLSTSFGTMVTEFWNATDCEFVRNKGEARGKFQGTITSSSQCCNLKPMVVTTSGG